MRPLTTTLALVATLAVVSTASAQNPDLTAELQWRQIGPNRAGRARAAVGVPQQPNTFYAGFDNGGIWRTTDFGSNWEPIFDNEPTGSIGAIAVAPSNPNIIYVGSGAAIIRPDLATGDGMYKSTDAGKTWTHLGLRETQMIAWVEVDPKDPNRLFVAALGHPYGPNAERGIFRSTDGGQTFQKVLYTDEYTSGNDVRIDPSNPDIVYAAMWQQQQAYIEGGAYGGTDGGIYKSTDGGTTWKPLTDGLPDVIEANLAIAPSNPRTLYATVAGIAPAGGGGRGGRGGGRGGAGGGGRGGRGGNTTTGTVGLYKSIDGGEHWFVARSDPSAPEGPGGVFDPRPLGRIGGGDLPTVTVDPKNPQVVYTASTVTWRSEDGGSTWTAVRGSPGGDDYQRIWINPDNPDIIFEVADQGAVISANRGKSWSNWYTQPTAAMYHVTADMDFPYRLCGGQQDSGSACVSSRSSDGEITFNDWHPVNIQEYGIAAPDPRDPDMVFGSARNGVSLWDRRTRQTRQVGPAPEQRSPGNGVDYGRNVRTMPIIWSPASPDVLYYASNVVWKTTDRAHSWTRISPDLARQAWEIPATVGQYAEQVNPGPAGSITALQPSPRSVNIIWAGTDDGNVQVTMDGGAHWSNVTPPAIKPWTRIFNLDAGHFDNQTAYVAANTMRIDDMNPHFWRTHDGGKTWTEINTGMAPGAVSNSIREDPRTPGLLFAATDTQIWVSYDDGDHWQSLRIDMPAISVRDIRIKDDSTCMCADLVAGTHGRGFWILDDITPLRQMAAAQKAAAANTAYLFKPVTAVRVRFAENDPTPWPPEWPAGENPPAGAIIDYYLPAGITGGTKLEILDAAGNTLRQYASTDPVLEPDPYRNPAQYNKVCQRTPSAPHCDVPLYWAPPSDALSNRPGAHRFTWDMRYDPLPGAASRGGNAVLHRTYPAANSPWVAPGNYTVRLTAGGRTSSQPITVRLDPRVKISATALAQLNALTREMRDGAVAARAAYARARAFSGTLESAGGADAAALMAQVDSIAPAAAAGGRGGRGFGGRGGAPAGPPNLESAANQLMQAAMGMQNADAAPTAANIDAVNRARAASKTAMARWSALSTTGLTALNAKRKAAGLAAVTLP